MFRQAAAGLRSALTQQNRFYQWNTRTGQRPYTPTTNRIVGKRETRGKWATLRKRQPAYQCRICGMQKLPFNYCRRQDCRDERP